MHVETGRGEPPARRDQFPGWRVPPRVSGPLTSVPFTCRPRLREGSTRHFGEARVGTGGTPPPALGPQQHELLWDVPRPDPDLSLITHLYAIKVKYIVKFRVLL